MSKIKVNKKVKKKHPQSIVETYTGVKFDVLNPDPDNIRIEDMAHSLSNQCRYGGHCRKFYSVAEHSVLVMQILKYLLERKDDRLKTAWLLLGAFLHDTSEGYLVDIPTPVKLHLSNYIGIEHNLMDAIFLHFKLLNGDKDNPIQISYDDPQIKFADKVALKFEASVLLSSGGGKWLALADFDDNGFPMEILKIRCLKPKQAEAFFLYNFYALLNNIHPTADREYNKIRYRNKYYMTRMFGWFV